MERIIKNFPLQKPKYFYIDLFVIILVFLWGERKVGEMDYKGIAKQGIGVFLLSMLVVPVSFFIRVFFARNLSVVDYGNLYALFSFFSILNLIRFFGVDYQTSSFFINKYIANKEHGKLKGFFYFAFSLVLFLSFVLVFLLIIFNGFLVKELFHDAGHIREMLPWMAAFWFFSGFFVIASNFIISFSRQVKARFSDFVRLLCVFGFFWILKKALPAYLAAVMAYFLGAIVGTSLAIFFFYRLSKPFLKAKAFFSMKMLKEILSFSWNIILLGAIGTLLSNVDVMFIQIFKGAKGVAFYNVAFPSANFILFFISPLLVIISPLFSKLWHEKDHHMLKRLTTFLINNFLTFLLPIVIFVVTFAQLIILHVFGPQYLEAKLSLELFALFFIFKGVNSVIIPILIAMNQPQKASRILLVGLIINFLLDFFLVPSLSYLGATFSTGVAQIAITFLLVKALKKIQPFGFSISQNLKVGIAGALFFLSVVLLKNLFSHLSLHSEFLVLLVGSLVFLIGFVIYIGLLILMRVITREKVDLLKSIVMR